jgi:hypothetical protein
LTRSCSIFLCLDDHLSCYFQCLFKNLKYIPLDENALNHFWIALECIILWNDNKWFFPLIDSSKFSNWFIMEVREKHFLRELIHLIDSSSFWRTNWFTNSFEFILRELIHLIDIHFHSNVRLLDALFFVWCLTVWVLTINLSLLFAVKYSVWVY